MFQTGNFRSRNLRRFQRQQSKPKLMKTNSSFRSQARSSSRMQNQSIFYKAALVYDNHSDRKQIIHEFNADCKRQIASLTKIMTCYTALQYINFHNLIPEDVYCDVSKQAAALKGTTSQLQQGNIISLWDLLHGLMLPSGNDAAYCVAESIGKLIKQEMRQEQLKDEKGLSSRLKYKRRQIIKRNPQNQSEPVAIFVKLMNKNAELLQMVNTQYNNPHGLADHHNYSTTKDQLLLIKQSLKNKLFRKIINTKLYFGCVKQKDQMWTRQIIWQNTNKLLGKGYQGIKTGNTAPAGYCLASWYCIQNYNLIIIILGCQTKQQRDFHTIRLTKLNLIKRQQKN